MFKKIAAAAALVIASSSAIAQDATKFYAGAELSSTKLDGYDREGGFGGFVGYKFNQNIAIEAGYNRLAKVDGVNFDQTIVSAIGTLPLSNGFSVYGRLGYNDLKANDSSDGVSVSIKLDDGVVYGAGIGYQFSPVVTGRMEVQKPISEVTKITAGVSFHF